MKCHNSAGHMQRHAGKSGKFAGISYFGRARYRFIDAMLQGGRRYRCRRARRAIEIADHFMKLYHECPMLALYMAQAFMRAPMAKDGP